MARLRAHANDRSLLAGRPVSEAGSPGIGDASDTTVWTFQSHQEADRVTDIGLFYAERDGWTIWCPSADGLEAGTFQFPFAETGRKEIVAWEPAVLLEGIDLSRGRRRERYSLSAARHEGKDEKAGKETRAS